MFGIYPVVALIIDFYLESLVISWSLGVKGEISLFLSYVSVVFCKVLCHRRYLLCVYHNDCVIKS